ncbi:MAG: hypothetical protein WCZ28_02025 [Burkholderiaceae bacterium]
MAEKKRIFRASPAASNRNSLQKLQRTQRWLNRLISFLLFASLVALSSLVMRDLEQLSPPVRMLDMLQVDEAEHTSLRQDIEAVREQLATMKDTLSASRQVRDAAQSRVRRAEAEYVDWLALRSSTEAQETNPEVQARLAELGGLRSAERQANEVVLAQEGERSGLQRREAALARTLGTLERRASERAREENRARSLKAFGIRLAVVLPILLAGIYLFARHRNARYGALVWGFSWFALYVFFFGLVPYLPSFGGYIRFIGAVVLVLAGGVYSVRWFNAYLARRREELARDARERAQHIDMDQAVGAFRSKTCPSCGQDFSLSGPAPNFCLECGLELFSKCDCGTLNFAFFRHCSNCNRPVGGKSANPNSNGM